MVTYQPVTQADITELAQIMREVDRQETAAATGESPEVGLTRSWKDSIECFSARDEAGVLAVWGVSKAASEDAGCPWMVGTERVADYAKLLVRDARITVNRWSDQFMVLENFVSVDNVTSIAWLQALGFTIGSTIPEFGVGKKPFYHFYRINHVRCHPGRNADCLSGVSSSVLRPSSTSGQEAR